MTAASKESITVAAKEFLNFINKSPSPFHAVDECRKRLLSVGFVELKEADHWKIKPLDKCFVTKNQSTLIAFAVGGQYQPGNGFSIVGAHTDSPCLKVKPASKRSKHGYIQLGVQLYGGGIWHSWFDRDLKLAGRVMVKENNKMNRQDTTYLEKLSVKKYGTSGSISLKKRLHVGDGAKIDHRLVNIDRPILRVPNIAIHLSREQNDKFEFNKESHLMPILATTVREQLESPSEATSGSSENASSSADKHHPVLMKLLSDELKVNREDILDFELCLADFVPGTIGGVFDEFIFSARLDNLHSSFCALQGLIESCQSNTLEADTNVRMISLFDNEEVGSESAQGACSALQEHILRRLSSGNSSTTAFEESIPKSIMVSADMAHGVHPNFSLVRRQNSMSAEEVARLQRLFPEPSCLISGRTSGHQNLVSIFPEIDDCLMGVVLKFNANQRYATTAVTTAMMREIAKLANVPLQDFVVRNDSSCGSTIGPIMSAKLGIQTIDLGSPQLSMHSIREMCCTTSVRQATDLFKTFFEKYPTVYAATTGV